MLKRRPFLVAMIAGVSLFACPHAGGERCEAAEPAQPATPAKASPFDKDDPEIGALRKLDTKGIDFDKLDARTRCTAYFALNRGLQSLGSKADARLELLIDYIDEQELGAAYAADKEQDAPFKPASFDELEKVAAAYLQTPAGSAKFGKEMATLTDEILGRYLTLYEKTARREYDEGVESRLQVRSMALFLEHKGKLEAFKQWAADERQRRQEAFEKERAEQQAAAAQAAQEARNAREAALAEDERRRVQEEERAAAQVESVVQNSNSGGSDSVGSDSGGYDSDSSWGGSWGYGTGYYYYGNTYRGQVRDKAQDAGQRWRTGRPSQLPARRGGGGRRR